MVDWHENCLKKCKLHKINEKGKPLERVGRKASGPPTLMGSGVAINKRQLARSILSKESLGFFFKRVNYLSETWL